MTTPITINDLNLASTLDLAMQFETDMNGSISQKITLEQLSEFFNNTPSSSTLIHKTNINHNITSEELIYTDAVNNNIELILPDTPSNGHKINIIREDNSQDYIVKIKISANNTHTILQTGSYINIHGQHSSLTLLFYENNWQII